MNSELRLLGVVYGLAGGVMMAVGIARIEAATGDLDWIEPALLIGFGVLLGRLSSRFGGLSYLPQGVLVGLMFLWSGITARDSFERWFGLWMGAVFTLSAGTHLMVAISTRGLRSALLDPPWRPRSPGGESRPDESAGDGSSTPPASELT